MILSIERYCISYKPFLIINLNTKKCIRVLLSISILIFLWSLLPVIGWSHYTYETNDLQCAIEYNQRSIGVISFNVLTLLIFAIMPLLVIFYTSFKLLLIVRILLILVFNDYLREVVDF